MFAASQVIAQTDPYDPSSPNYVGKTKGKAKKRKYPKITGSVAATFFSGIEENSEPGLVYDGVAGFKISEKYNGSIGLSYSHPTDFTADRPDRWEFEDVRIRIMRPSVWQSESKKQRLNLYGTFYLPTSGTSQDASLYSSARLRAQFTHSYRRFLFSASPTLALAYHEYETADEAGFVKNSPLGLSFGLSARFQASRRLGLNLGASLYSYVDYDFNNYNVETISTSADFAVTKKTYLAAGFRWRDRRITNNSLFDEDAILGYVSLSYNF